jgi:hypothetical protein
MEQDRSSDLHLTEQEIGLSFQPAAGWWIATDDKWYPPELHPDYQPPVATVASTATPSGGGGSTLTSSQMPPATSPAMDPAAAQVPGSMYTASAGELAQTPGSAPAAYAVAPAVHAALISESNIPASPQAPGPNYAVSPPTTTTAAAQPEAGLERPAARAARKVVLTAWEGIWYVVLCVLAGMGYFAKIPAKKAMEDFRFCRMTSAEHFWYVVMCIFFGAGYLAKIPTAKALSELPQFRPPAERALQEQPHY